MCVIIYKIGVDDIMKKLISFVLALIIIASSLTVISSAAMKGDVNQDKTIDATDALLALFYSVGKPTEIADLTLADMNDDSRIDSTDALIILKISVGIDDPYEKFYAGKEYLIFGDSYTNTNPANGRLYNPWVPQFEDLMKPSKITNKGYSGTTWGFSYYTNSSHVPYGYELVQQAIDDKTVNPDVVLFLYGANDYESWYNRDIDKFLSYSDSELESMRGKETVAAMIWCLRAIKKNYPNADVFVCTAIPIMGTDFYLFCKDSTLKKRNKQIEIAQKLGVNVIDTYSCPLNNDDPAVYKMYYDYTTFHPNDTGARVIGRYIAGELKDYFINK